MLRAGLLQCLSSSCGLPLGLGSSTSSAALALQHLVLVGQQARNAATKAKGSSKKTPADAKPAKKATKKASAAADAPAKQRVLSAYQLFVKNRAVGGKGSGLLKTLAAEWKGMGEHQKAPYVNQAAVAKAQIMQEREAAKKPPNAYSTYFKEEFAKMGRDVKVTDAAKAIAVRWKALPEAERQQRKQQADAVMAAWKAARGQ